jgi:hypothetical protein
MSERTDKGDAEPCDKWTRLIEDEVAFLREAQGDRTPLPSRPKASPISPSRSTGIRKLPPVTRNSTTVRSPPSSPTRGRGRANDGSQRPLNSPHPQVNGFVAQLSSLFHGLSDNRAEINNVRVRSHETNARVSAVGCTLRAQADIARYLSYEARAREEDQNNNDINTDQTLCHPESSGDDSDDIDALMRDDPMNYERTPVHASQFVPSSTPCPGQPLCEKRPFLYLYEPPTDATWTQRAARPASDSPVQQRRARHNRTRSPRNVCASAFIHRACARGASSREETQRRAGTRSRASQVSSSSFAEWARNLQSATISNWQPGAGPPSHSEPPGSQGQTQGSAVISAGVAQFLSARIASVRETRAFHKEHNPAYAAAYQSLVQENHATDSESSIPEDITRSQFLNGPRPRPKTPSPGAPNKKIAETPSPESSKRKRATEPKQESPKKPKQYDSWTAHDVEAHARQEAQLPQRRRQTQAEFQAEQARAVAQLSDRGRQMQFQQAGPVAQPQQRRQRAQTAQPVPRSSRNNGNGEGKGKGKGKAKE